MPIQAQRGGGGKAPTHSQLQCYKEMGTSVTECVIINFTVKRHVLKVNV